MLLKNKQTAVALAFFALTMLLGSGCTSSRGHTYLLGRHVMSQAEQAGLAPLPQEYYSPGPGEFVAWTW